MAPVNEDARPRGTSAPARADRIEETAAPILHSLEEKQALLAHMVRMVARRISFGLFVAGPGGLGKSKVISETLAAERICPVLINSHITPLSLFMTLYQYRDDHIVWLDDADSVYGNLRILGLLRSALWGGDERIVTYSSTQVTGMPSSFVFNGRVIFCANTLPTARNPAFQAVLSRIDVFQLTASNEETLDLMRSLASRGYESLSPEACLEVVDFIATSGNTRPLSMRLYEPSLKKVIYARECGADWRELVRCQLDQIGVPENVPPQNARAVLFSCMGQAIAAHPESVRAQEEWWCRTTGRSRATFFRIKRAFEAERRSSRQA